MASAVQILALLSCLVGIGMSAISPFLPAGVGGEQKDNSVTEAPWAPATQPREFSYNIQDGILGANQVRHETWRNGTMEGMYAYPLGDGKWQVIDYIADAKGFRVTNSKAVSESELMGGHGPGAQQAAVDIDRDGDKTSYTVKASDINQKQKLQKQQQPQSAKGQQHESS